MVINKEMVRKLDEGMKYADWIYVIAITEICWDGIYVIAIVQNDMLFCGEFI